MEQSTTCYCGRRRVVGEPCEWCNNPEPLQILRRPRAEHAQLSPLMSEYQQGRSRHDAPERSRSPIRLPPHSSPEDLDSFSPDVPSRSAAYSDQFHTPGRSYPQGPSRSYDQDVRHSSFERTYQHNNSQIDRQQHDGPSHAAEMPPVPYQEERPGRTPARSYRESRMAPHPTNEAEHATTALQQSAGDPVSSRPVMASPVITSSGPLTLPETTWCRNGCGTRGTPRFRCEECRAPFPLIEVDAETASSGAIVRLRCHTSGCDGEGYPGKMCQHCGKRFSNPQRLQLPNPCSNVLGSGFALPSGRCNLCGISIHFSGSYLGRYPNSDGEVECPGYSNRPRCGNRVRRGKNCSRCGRHCRQFA